MRRNSQSDQSTIAEASDWRHPHHPRTVRATYDADSAHAVGGTKERIQQVALKLFVLHGYERTSLREIADHLGITKAALYYHYSSKQELLKSISKPLMDEFEALVAGDPDPETLLRSYIDLLHRHRAVFQLAATDHASLAAAELLERSVNLRREVVRQLAGPDAGPADYVLAAAAFGAIGQGFMLARRVEPAADPALPDPEAVAEAAAGMPAPAEYPDEAELTELLLRAALGVLGSRHLPGVLPGPRSGASAEKP